MASTVMTSSTYSPASQYRRSRCVSADAADAEVSSPTAADYRPFATSPARHASAASLPNHKSSHRQSSGGASSNSDDDSGAPRPPDGGWGWVVVIASFLTHVIADGSAFSFGVIFEELLVYFDDSKEKTAWIGSLYVSVPLLSGPIASVLTNRYGCRVTAMTGALITGIGLVLSSFANSIEMLYLTYGIMGGFGTALIFIPAVIVVAYYFEEKRAFATGLAVAGSGIGTAVFAPLTHFLIQTYSWKGAMLILGGLTFNCVAFAAVFWPIETQSINGSSHHSSLEKVSRWSSDGDVATTTVLASPMLQHSPETSGVDSGTSGSPAALELQRLLGSGYDEPTAQSLVLFPTYLQGDINGKSDHVIRQLMAANGGGLTLKDILTERDVLGMLCLKQSSLAQMAVSVTGSLNHKMSAGGDGTGVADDDNGRMAASASSDKQPLHKSHDGVARPGGGTGVGARTVRVRRLPLNRQDIFYRGTLRSALSRPPPDHSVSCPDIIVHVRRLDGEDEEEEEGAGCCQLAAVGRELMQILHDMLDVSVFRSVVFVYFCCSCLLLYGAYDVPYMFSPDLASDVSQSKSSSDSNAGGGLNSAAVIAMSGLTSTLGQVAFGYAGDQPRVNTMHLYTILTVLAGLSTVLVPLCTTYWLMLLYGALYGFFISGVYALTSILLVDLFGMARLTNTYGICFMCQGVAGLFGPPIAGRISDMTGSYDLAFILCGMVMVVSGLMLCLVPCLQRIDSRRLQDDTATAECSEDDTEQEV